MALTITFGISVFLQESAHVLAAYVSRIEVRCIRYLLYIGFILQIQTEYQSNINGQEFMAYLRIFTSRIMNNILFIFLGTLFKKILDFKFLENTFDRILYLNSILALSNSLIINGSNGYNIFSLLIYKMNQITSKDMNFLINIVHFSFGGSLISAILYTYSYCF